MGLPLARLSPHPAVLQPTALPLSAPPCPADLKEKFTRIPLHTNLVEQLAAVSLPHPPTRPPTHPPTHPLAHTHTPSI